MTLGASEFVGTAETGWIVLLLLLGDPSVVRWDPDDRTLQEISALPVRVMTATNAATVVAAE